MATGWIRAYADENSAVKSKISYYYRSKRSAFRKSFIAEMKASEDDNAVVLKQFSWGDQVELPEGLSKETWTKVVHDGEEGVILSKHLVEIAYVKRKGRSENSAQVTMTLENGDKKKLLWGDLIQIVKAGVNRCEVRARGFQGKMDVDDLTEEALLEVYFIDVGQGDGVLLRTPDGKHLLIDGGLERTKQQTGKNAADFVDWKFFADYGHYRIKLDSLMASHSDNDHYGGLHDLVRKSTMASRELDCTGVDIDTFHHPGLSRWKTVKNAIPPHKQGLGAEMDETFIQLLGDRTHAEQSVAKDAVEKLSGPWEWFISDILENSENTKFERVSIDEEHITDGKPLPLLWPTEAGCDIRVLSPVTKEVNGQIGLPNLGSKSFNTNGHSICLRIDYGSAKILMTGDLNSESMNWLKQCYGDRMGSWECDVAKACHHGSHDISYGFLEKIRAAATVISSGDAEGHSHPRPEIVGASAMTGYTSIDREKDRLITPLIYMTEIERSVSLGAINRIDIRKAPCGDDEVDVSLLGRSVDELNEKAFLSPEDRKAWSKISDKKEADKFLREVQKKEKTVFEAMENDLKYSRIKVEFNLSVPQGPLHAKNTSKRAWNARLMEKNHYGLVNVRTDGDLIMCATLDETEHKWVVHTFSARF